MKTDFPCIFASCGASTLDFNHRVGILRFGEKAVFEMDILGGHKVRMGG